MRFNRGARLDPSQVSDRRGVSNRGIAVGGGIGGLIAVLIALFTGQNVLDGGGTSDTTTPADEGNLTAACRTGADVEQNPECRFVVYVNSIQAYWDEEFARRGGQYTEAITTVFSDAVQTGCGFASSSAGPFYCPGDQKVYLDLGFFDELQTRFGGSGGDFAEAYVLAHEYGHHIQNLTGQMDRVRTRQGAGSDAVRLELQADCYAGVWARHATSTPDASGQPLITELTQEDIHEGLEAARIVGDDYIQERFQGTVTPETWTHGSSAQREQWFINGLQSGQLEACDTFSSPL
jgi:uncharacterized protein